VSFRKVLVLDVSRYNRETMKGLLVECGFDAETADNGETFLKALEWWRPDALLVDVEFTAGDDLDVERVLATAKEAKVPTIVMGARLDSVIVEMVHALGADAGFSTLRGLRGVQRVLDDLKTRLEKRDQALADKALDW
jgi:DNA-binding response OmpR family regulator